MAKRGAMGMRCYLDGYDLSGDIGSFSRIQGGPASTQDMTDITQSARARAGLIRSGGVDWVSFFNPTALRAHDRLSNLTVTSQLLTGLVSTTLGGPGFACNGLQLNYDPTRGADGSLTIAVNMLSNGYGLEWGEQLTAGLRTDTGATAGTGVDFAASTAFGLQAYLQVTEFTGTDVTVTIQESADDAAGDPYANVVGGAFATITTDPQAQRIETARGLTVERWLRVATTTSGGFASLSFQVLVIKNLTSVVF